MQAWKLGFLLLGLLILAACEKEPSNDSDKTTNLADHDILVISDPKQLSAGIRKADEVMYVESADDSRLKSLKETPKVDLHKNYSFKLRAEVDAPEYDGKKLMATHVKIHDDYAFVTYNTKGDEYLGGVEIFDVSDIGDPKSICRAIFRNADVSSVDYYNNKLYVVGALDPDSEMGARFRKPALLEVISLNGNHELASVDTVLNLDSYVGTDVRAVSDGIYATSGSNGFLKIYNHRFDSVFAASIHDARSVDVNSSHIYVLGGQPGEISVYDHSSHALNNTLSPGGASIAESKTEIAATDKYIFSALNDGGMKIYNVDGSLKQHIARPSFPEGGNADNYVTNSVSLNGDLVLMANGEAGLYIGGIVTNRNDSVFLLGTIRFGEYESSNFVESKDSIIFVATGLGGLKILSISIDEGVPDDIIPTKPCATLYNQIMTLFPESQNNLKRYPELFESQLTKSIVLTKESEVYITFVDEDAGWKNSLGYYTYDASTPPQTIEALEKHILFPNVSMVNEGGGLNTGDMVQVGSGKFKANTVIGFYLIAQGWNRGLVGAGRYTHYTDIQFNTGFHQQHTLFLEKTCNDLVMTFEDIDQDDVLSYNDKDFNDILFVISDNKDPEHKTANTAFDLRNIPVK